MMEEDDFKDEDGVKGQWEDVEVEVHEGLAVGMVVSVRFEPHEAEILRNFAEKTGQTLTAAVRNSVAAAIAAYEEEP